MVVIVAKEKSMECLNLLVMGTNGVKIIHIMVSLPWRFLIKSSLLSQSVAREASLWYQEDVQLKQDLHLHHFQQDFLQQDLQDLQPQQGQVENEDEQDLDVQWNLLLFCFLNFTL